MEQLEQLKMGTLAEQFNGGKAQSITFSVTENCNLRCKYCYMVHKNDFHTMSFETAKEVVDYVLAQPPREEAVIWEFIGGEPTLEMDLIDQITDYIKIQQYILNHPWHTNHIFFIGTNGVLYGTDKVQNYIAKNKNSAEFTITIDGTREKHDLQRVKIDGSGSYDDIVKNIPLWMKQFPSLHTKVTFASDDLPLLYDSIIHLWNMGILFVAANVVFEDVWKPGDPEVFESQLRKLADYIIENKLWNDVSVRFFDPRVGYQSSAADKKVNFCGTGKMLAVDYHGNFYPCVRFLDFCMTQQPSGQSPVCFGNCQEGINENAKEPFRHLNIGAINDDECDQCPISSGCFACVANNYDDSGKTTIYHRAKYICPMQKAQVRANKYFWHRYSDATGKVSPFEANRQQLYENNNWKVNGLKFLNIIISDGASPFCSYQSHGTAKMSKEIYDAALQFASESNMVPVFHGDPAEYLSVSEALSVHFKLIDSTSTYVSASMVENIIHIYVGKPVLEHKYLPSTCILRISKNQIDQLKQVISEALFYYSRVNIIKIDTEYWSIDDIQRYADGIVQIRQELLRHENAHKQINVLFESENDKEPFDCNAGIESLTVAPNGKIYICPAFYYENPDDYIEDTMSIPSDDVIRLLRREKSPVCSQCHITQCRRCVYQNKKLTKNYNIPAPVQCAVAHAEQNTSKKIER